MDERIERLTLELQQHQHDAARLVRLLRDLRGTMSEGGIDDDGRSLPALLGRLTDRLAAEERTLDTVLALRESVAS